MTTRHTISHADELYSGNAYQAGYSPDGRRGIKMTHLYAHEFLSTAGVPALVGDPDGFTCVTPSAATAWTLTGAELLALMSGPLVSSVGATVANLDVPRNIRWSSCNAVTARHLKIQGRDQYGEPMAETIRGLAAGVVASGMRCFKTVDSIKITGVWAAASIVIIGSGNKLGLPFHLANKGKLISVSVDGQTNTSGATAGYVVAIGASSATTMTSSGGQADARGFIKFVTPAPNGARRLTALMIVDHTTQRAAFGPPQVSLCTSAV